MRTSYRCVYEPTSFKTARWVKSNNVEQLNEFKKRNHDALAKDIYGNLMYLISEPYLLKFTQEKWPAIEFVDTQEL